MAYLSTETARQRRADPKQVLPECRSILSLGLRYPSPESLPFPPAGRPHGRIASYAWGEDYHFSIPDLLRRLENSLDKLAGHKVTVKGYTDTGPILERELAQRAGLGWIAKNTCLIDPRKGSYFLLAELFMDLDLEPDAPFTLDACGTCRRCIEACPTQCILPDRTIDSARCISYLTIENKGPIEPELRPAMGNWVFGCDVCQSVCPWNQRFARPSAEPAGETAPLTPRPGIPFPDLITELALTPQAYNQKFKRSPVQRPRRRGYLRNVAIALGNSGDEAGIPALTGALQSEPEALIRGAAAWALGQFNRPAARQALKKAASSETDPVVLEEIRHVLST
jgi:epoxyqueuosine reductase